MSEKWGVWVVCQKTLIEQGVTWSGEGGFKYSVHMRTILRFGGEYRTLIYE